MPDDLEFVRAFQRLVGEVFRLNGQLLSAADRLSGDLNVSTARWMTIAVIRNQPMTAAQIGRRLGVSRQNARQTVQRLQEQGLVELQDNPDHARSPLVALTALGEETMAALRERQIELTHRFTDGLGFSVARIDKLTADLERLRSHAEALDESLPDN
jgi:DNA-binding MarR family transcriptional regulator